MKQWIAAVAALALLGGCMKIDRSPPTDLPDYVKLYPGGQPMMKMSMGPLSAEVMTTTDKPDGVMAFYRNQAASDGLTEKTTGVQTAAGQEQATFTDATGSKMLVVAAKAQAPGSLLTLTYRPAPKPAGS